jgi:23S rRNA (cytidine1920-2'-O)/16S rRNA (cytidine1409-2'-O)-methyltransferase
MSGTRQRADRLLVARGIFESRAKAQAAIEAGLVTANDQIVRKASEEIPTDASLRATSAHPYVSRGALKLVAALDRFKLSPSGLVCLDVGASTGGFTEILLERGARRVYAVDVGHGQLHETLRARPEIVRSRPPIFAAFPAGSMNGQTL